MEFTPTGFTARNVTLRTLTQEAFDAYEPGHLAGGPPWFDKTAFNVEAKIDPDEQPNFRSLTLPQRRAMLQEVLEQRFHLETHTEMRSLPAFALVVAKGGEKMHPTPDAARVHGTILGMEGLVTKSGPGVLEGTGLTSNQLSRILTGYVERPVIDRTGLKGSYDIALRWSPVEADGAAKVADGDQPDLPDLYTVLQEQLGLRLEPTKSIATVVIIDVAAPPDAN
jgi:uncharacterized protein (TIGR03435 family)